MKKSLILLLVIAAVVFGIFYLIGKYNFPVAYKICGVDYQDCETIAKFKDRDSCETTKKKWNWGCNEKDKNNIICKEGNDSFSSAYCE